MNHIVGNILNNEDGAIHLYVPIVEILRKYIGTKMVKRLSAHVVKNSFL